VKETAKKKEEVSRKSEPPT